MSVSLFLVWKLPACGLKIAPNFSICFEPTSAHSFCRQSCLQGLIESEPARRKALLSPHCASVIFPLWRCPFACSVTLCFSVLSVDFLTVQLSHWEVFWFVPPLTRWFSHLPQRNEWLNQTEDTCLIILLALAEQMPSITEFWGSYLENNKITANFDFFVSILHHCQLDCNYVIQGKILTISLPWPFVFQKSWIWAIFLKVNHIQV